MSIHHENFPHPITPNNFHSKTYSDPNTVPSHIHLTIPPPTLSRTSIKTRRHLETTRLQQPTHQLSDQPQYYLGQDLITFALHIIHTLSPYKFTPTIYPPSYASPSSHPSNRTISRSRVYSYTH